MIKGLFVLTKYSSKKITEQAMKNHYPFVFIVFIKYKFTLNNVKMYLYLFRYLKIYLINLL